MKLLKGSKAPEGRLVALPVKLCEPHPDLQTRLKYDQIDVLAEDIRVHGQLQPGRAVERPDGTGYWVYLGIGRLLAIKALFEKEGEPKSYYALLDEGLPFLELFSRSMSENLKRRNLSVLEEVRSFWLASQKAKEDEIIAAAAKIGEDPRTVRKRMELAETLGSRLGRLYDVEAKAGTGFSFQIGHLEALATIGDQRALYEAAAACAVARFNVKELQNSLKNKSIDKISSGLPEWFFEVFPEYTKAEKPSLPTDTAEAKHVVAAPANPKADSPALPSQGSKDTGVPTGSTQAAAVSATKPESAAAASQPPAGVTYKEDQAFVECPYCGAQTPFELKEDSELTVIRFKGTTVPEKDSVAPEGSYRRRCECLNPACGEEFWLWAALADGEVKAAGRRKDDEGWFKLPTAKPIVGSVSWSAVRKAWIVKEKGSGREYLYGEDRKFLGI